MSDRPAVHDGRLLLTGATGFIGHVVLAEALRRGIRCAALVRGSRSEATTRLRCLLAEVDVDFDAHHRVGDLLLLDGDLDEGGLPSSCPADVTAVLHCAGSTRFAADLAGEPARTNVNGTGRLLEWMTGHGVRSLHLVSSAYQCGKAQASVAETIGAGATGFHNAYEESKRACEERCAAWSHQPENRLTVFRPSIVVGDAHTGRATTFSGFYLMARANASLAGTFEADDPARRAIKLRVCGRPARGQNLVSIDAVARHIVEGVIDPRWHGGVYHLTHPTPPTNQLIKEAIEQELGIAGGRFVDPEQWDEMDLTDAERLFYEISAPIRHYLFDSPQFERANGLALEQAAGVSYPTYDHAAVRRLLRYAIDSQWGRRSRRPASPTVEREQDDDLIATYFESFLPGRIAHSQIARMTQLSPTMRFVLRDVEDGRWLCRFSLGALVEVRRGDRLSPVQFTYTTTRDVFWEAVGARVDPQGVFLDDRAAVSGDVEAALKMAMILYRFNQECPCDRALLTEEARLPCIPS